MIPEILIIILLLGLLIFLIFTTRRPSDGKRDAGEEPEIFDEDGADDRRPCPLCGRMLRRGERVHSVVYSRGEDRLMNVFGCPWCYGGHPAGAKEPQRERHCPSCGVTLREGSFAVARVFERPGRKTHIHVLGCPVCRHSR